MNVYYYVSSHGYGHISRSSVVLEQLVREEKIRSIHLVSERHPFYTNPSSKIVRRSLRLDVGVFQKDSLVLDREKTKFILQLFESHKNQLLYEEADYCKKNDIDLVVTDCGSFPLTIAMEAKVPSLFIGNFTWDYIYSSFAKEDSYFAEKTSEIFAEYSFATLALYYPFFCPMPQFLESKSLGLVGRRSHLSKKEARKKFGFSDDKTYVLLSFGAYGLQDFPISWENIPSHVIPVSEGMPDLEGKCLNIPSGAYYPDLVRASDFVLTKPGYGILAECYLCETPILYTHREGFAEAEVLVQSLKRYFPSASLTHAEIQSGSWGEAMEKAKAIEKPGIWDQIPKEGELQVLREILEF